MKHLNSVLVFTGVFFFGLLDKVKSAYFDQFGNVIEDGNEASPSVYWPPVFKNQTEYAGAYNYYNCPLTFFKTWTGATPPLNGSIPAYGVTNANCWLNGDSPVSATRIVNNATILRDQRGINLDRYAELGQTTKRATHSIIRLNFATMNSTAFSIVQLNHTVAEMLSLNVTFYPIAKKMPAEDEEITSISIWAAVWRFRVVRASKGKFKGTLKSAKADTGFMRSHTVFKHTGNYFGDGAPVLDSNNNLLGVSILLDTEYNIANHLFGLDECFEPSNGLWNFSRSFCLRDWKIRYLNNYNYFLPGLGDVCTEGRCLETLSAPRNFTDDNFSNDLIGKISAVVNADPSDLAAQGSGTKITPSSSSVQTIPTAMISLLLSMALAIIL